MLSFARGRLNDVAGERAESVHMLMDFRANRKRLEQQSLEFDVEHPSEISTAENTEIG